MFCKPKPKRAGTVRFILGGPDYEKSPKGETEIMLDILNTKFRDLQVQFPDENGVPAAVDSLNNPPSAETDDAGVFTVPETELSTDAKTFRVRIWTTDNAEGLAHLKVRADKKRGTEIVPLEGELAVAVHGPEAASISFGEGEEFDKPAPPV